MKYVILILVSFTSITSAFCADVTNNSPGWYVQPSVVYMAERGDFKSDWSGALSAGYVFNKHHSVELELMSFKTDTLILRASGYSYEKDLKVVPLLMTYQYTFVLGKGFGLFGGISSQTIMEETNYTYYGQSGPPAGAIISETSYKLTVGGQIGLTYDFSSRATAVAAVKLLRVATSEEEYRIFELGLRYRF